MQNRRRRSQEQDLMIETELPVLQKLAPVFKKAQYCLKNK
jgi:hypothetical protein